MFMGVKRARQGFCGARRGERSFPDSDDKPTDGFTVTSWMNHPNAGVENGESTAHEEGDEAVKPRDFRALGKLGKKTLPCPAESGSFPPAPRQTTRSSIG
jgi:hypothetical protein